MDSIRRIIDEEFESAKERALTRIKEVFRDGNWTPAQRNMKLRFKNSICRTILTGDEIKGQDKNPFEVALVDEPTGNIVDVGPESSATVEVLLLKGQSNASEGDDWTIERFNENIVRDVEGKMSLLAGNKLVKLQNGIGFLENIKFRHHATKMRPSVFRLGARAVNTFEGVRIKEARTESFIVKDFRNKYYIKHKAPSLSDEVSRLVNIRKGGKIEERLIKDHNICTVEDFLVRFLIDPEGLKSIVNLGEKKWKLTIENALACPSDTRMYSYMNEQKTMGVVFNLLGQITGLYMERQYTPTNMLSERHKADAEELLESAYKHWEKVKPFDDENSFQQYLNGHENAGTYEMLGESSSRSNFSFSAMNSISVSGVKDFSSFGTDDVDITHDAFLQLSLFSSDFDNLFPGFDYENSLQQYFNGLDCPVGAHENAGTSEMIGESSSRSNFLFSAMNLISVSGVEDFSSFVTDDLEITHDAFLQLSPFSLDFDTLFPGFDEFLNQNDNWDTQHINKLNAVEFVESMDVQPARRWRKLLCVLKWFSIRKTVCVGDICNPKKQKVG